jgi:hypothetical protein
MAVVPGGREQHGIRRDGWIAIAVRDHLADR